MKVYVTRKYILANSAKEALRKEPKYKVDDVYTDDETHKYYLQELQEKHIGFKIK